MEIKNAKRAIMLKQWSEMVQMCRGSGQTVPVWCEANCINIKTYYYRLKQVRLAALENSSVDMIALQAVAPVIPTFAAITMSEDDPAETHSENIISSPAATIKVGDLTISIHNEAGDNTIASIIKAANMVSDGGSAG